MVVARSSRSPRRRGAASRREPAATRAARGRRATRSTARGVTAIDDASTTGGDRLQQVVEQVPDRRPAGDALYWRSVGLLPARERRRATKAISTTALAAIEQLQRELPQDHQMAGDATDLTRQNSRGAGEARRLAGRRRDRQRSRTAAQPRACTARRADDEMRMAALRGADEHELARTRSRS